MTRVLPRIAIHQNNCEPFWNEMSQPEFGSSARTRDRRPSVW